MPHPGCLLRRSVVAAPRRRLRPPPGWSQTTFSGLAAWACWACQAWRRFSLHEGVTDETTIVCVPWAIHRLLSLYEVRLPSVGLVKQGRFHKIACYWLLAVRTMEREKGSTSRWREWGCVTKLDMRSGHRRHASTSLRERGPSGRRSSTSLVQWCNSAVVLWCCGALDGMVQHPQAQHTAADEPIQLVDR